MDFISPEGLRLDGRRPFEVSIKNLICSVVPGDELCISSFDGVAITFHFICLFNFTLVGGSAQLRQLHAEIGVLDNADGSATFEMGNTKVIAVVYGPREVQNRSQQQLDHALVRCEYSMATFSTGDRRRRGKGDRRGTELSLVIRQTMEAAILTNLLPRSQIDIFVQVLQADGGARSLLLGTRACCINAAALALADAGIPMRDLVASCSAGYLNSTPLLDLNYLEDSGGGPDLTVALFSKLDKVTLLQMDAKVPLDVFEKVMNLASEGAKAVTQFLRELAIDSYFLGIDVVRKCSETLDIVLSGALRVTLQILMENTKKLAFAKEPLKV
ncbi:hypothetical protein AXG93_1913s1950 [Marchantia polymorpha subsp. ruderalis]|uniref:Uncharacterized protein n=1 Tax=Marchantia polymorpha subsp. ruderalis TaxID=1480154 RepID=A0A176WKC9_MARPO|nr:hypothetical protein AXG93_1913s1950 [Marchantia polymorpha subsp. ruderalis]